MSANAMSDARMEKEALSCFFALGEGFGIVIYNGRSGCNGFAPCICNDNGEIWKKYRAKQGYPSKGARQYDGGDKATSAHHHRNEIAPLSARKFVALAELGACDVVNFISHDSTLGVIEGDCILR